MIKSGKRSLMFLSAASLVLWLGHAESYSRNHRQVLKTPT